MKKLIEKLLKYLTYVLVASLLLSYLSVHISPEFFWPLAFFGLAFPYILLINILFAIFWIVKWKRIALLVILIIFLGYNHMRSTATNLLKAHRDHEQNREEELKVLSYNVRAFNLYEWLTDPNTNKGIFNFIRSEHPDVICLQEFYTSNKMEFSPRRYARIFGETPYSHIEYAKRSSGDSGFGVAIFSRFPIINHGRVFRRGGNQAVYADILYNTDTIRIFNCHLQSLSLKMNNYEFLDSLRIRYDEQQIRELQDISIRIRNAFVKRAGQAKKIHEIIKTSPYPVIVCGDFNDTPVSYAYRKIKANMRDAWQIAGRGLGHTYQGRLSFRIDYILYDRAFQAKDFERVKTQLSDHYPIFAILKLQDDMENNN